MGKKSRHLEHVLHQRQQVRKEGRRQQERERSRRRRPRLPRDCRNVTRHSALSSRVLGRTQTFWNLGRTIVLESESESESAEEEILELPPTDWNHLEEIGVEGG